MPSTVPIRVLVLAALACAAPAGVRAQGDGSDTDNLDLLRTGFSPFCERAMLCHYGTYGSETPPQTPNAAPEPTRAQTSLRGETLAPQSVSRAVPRPAVPSPEPAGPGPWDFGAEVSLRGSFVREEGGESEWRAQAVPRISASRSGLRTALEVDAQATIVQPLDESPEIGGASASGTVSHRLNRDTDLSISGSANLSDGDASVPETIAAQPQDDPLELNAALEGTATRRFGKARASLDANVGRDVQYDTPLDDGTRLDNSGGNRWRYGGGLRLGYEATPILSPFVAGSVGRDDYDSRSQSLGVFQSGWTYDARAGLSASPSDRLTLEGSVGRGWYDFDSETLTDTSGWLFDASAEYRPSETLTLRAGFESEIDAATDVEGASSQQRYAVSAGADYQINRWLAVAADAGYGWTNYDNAAGTRRSYTAGVGATWRSSRHLAFSTDYNWSYEKDPAVAEPTREHRVTVGVTFER